VKIASSGLLQRVYSNLAGCHYCWLGASLLSSGTTLWPMFWPSRESVTLTLDTGSSTLQLPERETREDDEHLADFEGPANAPPQEQEQLEPGNYTRHLERDETTGEVRLTVIEDSGLTRLGPLGCYGIRDEDPDSASLGHPLDEPL
jgi:hypothetical protein